VDTRDIFRSSKTYVDDSVLEYNDTYAVDIDCAFYGSLSLRVRTVFELPALSTFIELETWIVIAFVQIFENAGKDFWFVVGQIDTLCRLEKLVAAERSKVWTVAQNIFMSGKESLLTTDAQCNDSTCEGSDGMRIDFAMMDEITLTVIVALDCFAVVVPLLARTFEMMRRVLGRKHAVSLEPFQLVLRNSPWHYGCCLI
jgi:hypothetical protein